MARQRHRRNISREKVYNYWVEKQDQLGELSIGGSYIWWNSCFACGNNRFLEVCHIVPMAFGGSDEPENLQILCKRCHGESECLKAYWPWLKWKRANEWQDWKYHWLDLTKKCNIEFPAYDLRVVTEEENRAYFNSIMNQLYWLCEGSLPIAVDEK